MICPRCLKKYNSPPALSRMDGNTEICTPCSVSEALESVSSYLGHRKISVNGEPWNLARPYKGRIYWNEEKRKEKDKID